MQVQPLSDECAVVRVVQRQFAGHTVGADADQAREVVSGNLHPAAQQGRLDSVGARCRRRRDARAHKTQWQRVPAGIEGRQLRAERVAIPRQIRAQRRGVVRDGGMQCQCRRLARVAQRRVRVRKQRKRALDIVARAQPVRGDAHQQLGLIVARGRRRQRQHRRLSGREWGGRPGRGSGRERRKGGCGRRRLGEGRPRSQRRG